MSPHGGGGCSSRGLIQRQRLQQQQQQPKDRFLAPLPPYILRIIRASPPFASRLILPPFPLCLRGGRGGRKGRGEKGESCEKKLGSRPSVRPSALLPPRSTLSAASKVESSFAASPPSLGRTGEARGIDSSAAAERPSPKGGEGATTTATSAKDERSCCSPSASPKRERERCWFALSRWLCNHRPTDRPTEGEGRTDGASLSSWSLIEGAEVEGERRKRRNKATEEGRERRAASLSSGGRQWWVGCSVRGWPRCSGCVTAAAAGG